MAKPQSVARTGFPVFDRLRYGRQPQTEAVLFAFDLLEVGGKGLRRAPLEDRKGTLAKLVRKASWAVQLNEHIAGRRLVFRLQARQRGDRVEAARLPLSLRSLTTLVESKNQQHPAVTREATEDWGAKGGYKRSATRSAISTLSGLQSIRLIDNGCECYFLAVSAIFWTN
jgi:hypothetical protein